MDSCANHAASCSRMIRPDGESVRPELEAMCLGRLHTKVPMIRRITRLHR